MFVDIICEHNYLRMPFKHLGKSLELLTCVYTARWIWRRIEHKQTRIWCDSRFKLLRCDLEILLHSGIHKYRFAFGKLHHFHIAHPSRNWDYHLVTGIDSGEQRVAQLLLGSVAYNYLFGWIVKPVLPLQLVADGFSQWKVSRHRRIMREIRIDGCLGSFLDMLRSIKIRLTDWHVDDIDSCGTKFRTLLRHGDCSRCREIIHSLWNKVHRVQWFFR